MKFTVIDAQTGEYPDLQKIALEEEWAAGLCYCDVDAFAIMEDGSLVLIDDCGKCAWAPEGRFKVRPEIVTNADLLRSSSDRGIAEILRSFALDIVVQIPGTKLSDTFLDEVLAFLRKEICDGET